MFTAFYLVVLLAFARQPGVATTGTVVAPAFASPSASSARSADSSSGSAETVVPSIPSRVVLENVSQSYPVTLLSKLFSSVPKREYALRDVSLTIGGGWGSGDGDGDSDVTPPSAVTVLVGSSGSGKSTLLRLLARAEDPVEGMVRVESGCFTADGGNIGRRDAFTARPVTLDRKPDVYGDSRSIRERIADAGGQAVAAGEGKMAMDTDVVKNRLVSDFASVLGLTDEDLGKSAADLNPSSVFLFGLACGCMESSCPALPALFIPFGDAAEATETSLFGNDSRGVPYPIVLLDELFDFEHSSVAAKCATALDRLAKRGAAVAVATHKPHHWEGVKDRRVLTLNGGRLL